MGRSLDSRAKLLAWALASAASAGFVGCGPALEPAEETSTELAAGHDASEDAGTGVSVPRGPAPTTLGAELLAMGLDLRNLPALHDLDPSTKLKVMRTFTRTLGVQCVACHDAADYAKPTPQKDVATRGWEDVVRKLSFAQAAEGGGALYCDSCHYGAFHFLNRSDRPALKDWMRTNFVEKLQRNDGAPMDCSACHNPTPTAEHG